MLLSISSIKPALDPIRKTWDEEKLNELAQSIAEQGLIVPIKVRPHVELNVCRRHGYAALAAEHDFDGMEIADCIQCGKLCEAFWGQENLDHAYFEYEEGEIEPARPFEVVYGHRRLEAMRRNGATEIEAIVEGVDDTSALVQALIENVQREDMSAIDRALAIRALKERKGWSNSELGRSGIIARKTAEGLLSYLEEVEAGNVDGARANKPGDENIYVVREVREVLGNEPELRKQVLRKQGDEGLTGAQTRRVAESVAAAPSPEARKVLLESEYSPVIHDPELIKSRAQTYGAHDPLYRTDNGKTQQKTWDNTPEVKLIIDGVINAAKSWTMLIAEIRKMVEVGKMAPEGKTFTANKLRNLAQTLNSFADELEEEREREYA